jgi:hypothetical protein
MKALLLPFLLSLQPVVQLFILPGVGLVACLGGYKQFFGGGDHIVSRLRGNGRAGPGV